MQDQNYEELKKGDRVIISRYKVPNRAVIEDISENRVSVLMFHFYKIPKETSWQWEQTAKSHPEKIKDGYYYNTSRWTLSNVTICDPILKLEWQFTEREADFYKTNDPSTLIKEKKQSSTVVVSSFLAGNTNWMKENLDVAIFNNGDQIPLVTDKKEWKKCAKEGKPACCYYNNDKGEFGTRGLLYNIHAISDSRGMYPKGWRLPTEAEYRELINLYGGQNVAGKRLRNQKGWYDGPFMTMSDFNGLPNGSRRVDGEFEGEGYYGQWLMGDDKGNYMHMILRGEDIDALIFPVTDFGNAYSVRGVKPRRMMKLPPLKEGAIANLENTKIKINNLDREFVIFQEYAFRLGAYWRDWGQKKIRLDDQEWVYIFIDENLRMELIHSVTAFSVFWHKLNRKGDADYVAACEKFYSKDKRKEISYEAIFEIKKPD